MNHLTLLSCSVLAILLIVLDASRYIDMWVPIVNLFLINYLYKKAEDYREFYVMEEYITIVSELKDKGF